MRKGLIFSNNIVLATIFILILGFIACENDTNDVDEIEDDINEQIDTSNTKLIKFNNTLFSIPSPYQIAYLVKEMNIDYNKELLNPVNNANNYTSVFQKSLNLGIYGADLGYLNIYEQTPDAVSYFSTVKILSQELNLTNAFSKSTIKSIENNMGNTDSLMFIISNTYRKADEYLKENGREKDGVLILAGGWVESLYIITQIANTEDRSQKIINRIGEQKHPLDNLIKILSPYYNNSENYAEIIDALIELAYVFDGVDIKYKYIEPEIDVENKIAHIKSETEVLISDQQLKDITEKVIAIRKKMIE